MPLQFKLKQSPLELGFLGLIFSSSLTLVREIGVRWLEALSSSAEQQGLQGQKVRLGKTTRSWRRDRPRQRSFLMSFLSEGLAPEDDRMAKGKQGPESAISSLENCERITDSRSSRLLGPGTTHQGKKKLPFIKKASAPSKKEGKCDSISHQALRKELLLRLFESLPMSSMSALKHLFLGASTLPLLTNPRIMGLLGPPFGLLLYLYPRTCIPCIYLLLISPLKQESKGLPLLLSAIKTDLST